MKKTIFCIGVVVVCLLVASISLGAGLTASEKEKQEYKQELSRIKSLRKSFKPGKVNDLKKYEKFADKIHSKWGKRNKEHNARLMLEVCKPLSSGTFKDDRRYKLARKYALSVLETADSIPLTLELELTGHVVTLMCIPSAAKGDDFAQRRKKDVEIRLHAWKRLLDAIDPKWDPDERLISNIVPPAATGLPSGVDPAAIKDPVLRAEYEAAIKKNSEKNEKWGAQYKLSKWLKRYPKRAEEYIVRAYSKPPFNLKELEQYLKKYIADEKTKARMLDAVKKNMEKQTDKK
ncbi:MAG: hypothetical protein ACYTF1_17755 [Planctomycetota bacterium]|jgi:hypothetical protein